MRLIDRSRSRLNPHPKVFHHFELIDETATEEAKRQAKFDKEIYEEMWQERLNERENTLRLDELIFNLTDFESQAFQEVQEMNAEIIDATEDMDAENQEIDTKIQGEHQEQKENDDAQMQNESTAKIQEENPKEKKYDAV